MQDDRDDEQSPGWKLIETFLYAAAIILIAFVVFDRQLSKSNFNPIFSPAVVVGMDTSGNLLQISMRNCNGNNECTSSLCSIYQTYTNITSLAIFPEIQKDSNLSCSSQAQISSDIIVDNPGFVQQNNYLQRLVNARFWCLFFAVWCAGSYIINLFSYIALQWWGASPEKTQLCMSISSFSVNNSAALALIVPAACQFGSTTPTYAVLLFVAGMLIVIQELVNLYVTGVICHRNCCRKDDEPITTGNGAGPVYPVNPQQQYPNEVPMYAFPTPVEPSIPTYMPPEPAGKQDFYGPMERA